MSKVVGSPIDPPPARSPGDGPSPATVSPRTTPPAVEPATGERPGDVLNDLGDDHSSIRTPKSNRSPGARPPWPGRIKQALIDATLLSSLIAFGAFLSIKAKTSNGTIQVDDIPADAQVEVENGTMTITRAGDTATVAEVPLGREYRIKVVKGDVTLWAEAVTVQVGGMPVRLRYKREAVLAATESRKPDSLMPLQVDLKSDTDLTTTTPKEPSRPVPFAAYLNEGDLAEESVQDAGLLDEMPAHHLEDLGAAQERVVGEVDDAHPAPAEFTPDLVVGVVGQARGSVSAGRGGTGCFLIASWDQSGLRTSELAARASLSTRTLPRRLSPDSPATRQRHSSQTSRCRWIAPAGPPSSLPAA